MERERERERERDSVCSETLKLGGSPVTSQISEDVRLI